MRMSARVKGVKPMQRKMREARARVERDALLALTTEAKTVMRKANSLTPKKEGDLRASAETDRARREGRMLLVTMGFGRSGPSAAYALAIHEHPSQHSPPSWGSKPIKFTTRGTGHKYLERPLRESEAGMNDRIAARIRL